MNIVTTVQNQGDPLYVSFLFTRERIQDRFSKLPSNPPIFSFPSRLSYPVEGGYLYLVYRNGIVGYGRISKVIQHCDGQLGINESSEQTGDAAVLEGPLSLMPFRSWCRDFTKVRYTKHNLHQLDSDSAQYVISDLGLSTPQRILRYRSHEARVT